MEKISKTCHDLDLEQIMPNVELVRAIFIYYNISKFQVDLTIIFELSCTQTDTHQHRQTDRHTNKHEYSIVAVDKPQL